jgi:hypothetical protein
MEAMSSLVLTFLKKYNTFLKKYNTFLKKYNTFLKRYNTFLKRYNTFLKKHNTFLKRYNTFLKRYNTFLKKYNTFLKKSYFHLIFQYSCKPLGRILPSSKPFLEGLLPKNGGDEQSIVFDLSEELLCY